MASSEMQALVAGGVLLLALVIPLFFLFRMSKAPPPDADEHKPQPKVRKDKADKEGGKKKGKRAMDRMRQAKDRRDDDGGDVGDGDGPGAGDEDDDDDREGLTKDELKKVDKRAEKAQAARERDEMREAMREREEAKLDSRKQREEEREAKWKAKEEAAALKKAEEEKKAQEEFEKWKDLITVDDEGTGDAEVGEEDQGLLANFVSYIKDHKVVVLEDLAAAFELRVQDVISRVQGLEQMGYITGVVDDRGKFIYVSTEEMDAVAKFITKRGRVSITALAAESNKLIDLNSKAVDPVDTGDDDIDEGAAAAGTAES